ncbi:MAG: hypothetical protein ACRDWD_14670, partial [Acidimicrobiia bacterium]
VSIRLSDRTTARGQPADPTEPGSREGDGGRARSRVGPPIYVLLPIFAVLAFAITFGKPARFGTHIAGDGADGLLVLWILGWVQHAIPLGWDAIWNANNYFPAPDTLAYAESMLPVAVVEWPLRWLFGDAAGLNVLSLAAETACLWFTYRLAIRLTGAWQASVVAAFAFSFSSPRLSQLGHTQLTLAGFLVPLVFLLLLEYFDRPRLTVAAAMGVALAVTATSAAYYGVMMLVAVPIFVIGYVIWFRPPDLGRFALGLGAGAAVTALIVVPIGLEYTQLHEDPHFETGFVPRYAVHIDDFLVPPQRGYVLPELPFFEDRAFDHSLERRLFPGIVAFAFGVVGLVVVIGVLRRPRPRDLFPERSARLALLLGIAGVVTLILAFGDEVTIAGHTVPLPYQLLRDHVPGFSGIRVVSRFVLVTQLALAVVAAFGVRALLERMGRNLALIVTLALSAFVVVETAVKVPMFRVPEGNVADAVGEELADRPDGVVVELPMMGPAEGVSWAYLESPRQYASLLDHNPRVNGYSGFAPEGFDDVVAALNTFPSRDALQVADAHGVRYVVLRTEVIGTNSPRIREILDEDGRYRAAEAERIIDRIPRSRLAGVTPVDGAFILELRPSPAR